MQHLMFVEKPQTDNRTDLQNSIYQTYASILQEVATLLKEKHYSAHELYEILIHKGLLRPAYFSEFHRFVRWAIREGYIDKDRVISRTIAGVRIPNRFTRDQLISYFNVVDDPRIAVASFIGIWSGLRIGDVVRLRIEDFDFEREIVKVVQSKRSKDRISPFLREGQAIIEKWIKYSGAEDYLFPSFESHSMATINEPHVSVKTISNGFNKVVHEAGLQRVDDRYILQNNGKRKKFSFHTFRHTFCTVHLENEVPAAFVARAAGHSHMDTTINVYGHMATGNMIQLFRRSFEKGKKPQPKKEKKETTGFNPIEELTKQFISGEISEEVFKRKKQVIYESLG